MLRLLFYFIKFFFIYEKYSTTSYLSGVDAAYCFRVNDFNINSLNVF